MHAYIHSYIHARIYDDILSYVMTYYSIYCTMIHHTAHSQGTSALQNSHDVAVGGIVLETVSLLRTQVHGLPSYIYTFICGHICRLLAAMHDFLIEGVIYSMLPLVHTVRFGTAACIY